MRDKKEGVGVKMMKEKDLHNALILNPSLIEEGLRFKGSEVYIQGKRCDLLFEDKFGNDLYVEVKKHVDYSAVGQLVRYDGLVNDENARFMLVGFSFLDGLKEGLQKRGFEFKEIPEKVVSSYVARLVNTSVQSELEAKTDHSELIEFYQTEMKNMQAKMEQRFNFMLSEIVMLKEKVNSYEW